MSKQASGPRVSIVTVSLNQGEYLEDTLRSVREQTYPNIEHVVMDGGSTDDSLDLIQRHEKECPFPLQWRSEPDRGQSHAYNKAFALCSGEWILYLNSSDYLAGPDAIERAMALVEDKPGYQMYGFPYLLIDEEGGPPMPYENTMPVPQGGGEVGLRKFHEIHNRYLPHEATFFHRELVERIGGYSERCKWYVDIDFFCRTLRQGPLWLFDSLHMVVFRHHPGMRSVAQATGTHLESFQRSWEHWWPRARTGANPFSSVMREYPRRVLRHWYRVIRYDIAPRLLGRRHKGRG